MNTQAQALEARMQTASRALSRFVIDKARKVQRQIGFGYVEAADAPNNMRELMAAFENSKRTGQPLPVFSGASEGTIYTSKEANWAFRFWHDVVHCQHDLGFNFADEVSVAWLQGEAVAAEFGKESMEYRMFMADTAGQSLYAQTHGGEFPVDQWAYVAALVAA